MTLVFVLTILDIWLRCDIVSQFGLVLAPQPGLVKDHVLGYNKMLISLLCKLSYIRKWVIPECVFSKVSVCFLGNVLWFMWHFSNYWGFMSKPRSFYEQIKMSLLFLMEGWITARQTTHKQTSTPFNSNLPGSCRLSTLQNLYSDNAVQKIRLNERCPVFAKCTWHFLCRSLVLDHCFPILFIVWWPFWLLIVDVAIMDGILRACTVNVAQCIAT